MSVVRLNHVVACDRNYAIGQNNQLLFRSKDDLAHFRRLTVGHPVIMGRKTFESIGYPLKDRLNIVVSRQPHTTRHQPGLVYSRSLDHAIMLARSKAAVSGATEVFIIGGEKIYQQTLHLIDRIVMTEIDHTYPSADAHYPFDPLVWGRRVIAGGFPATRETPKLTIAIYQNRIRQRTPC